MIPDTKRSAVEKALLQTFNTPQPDDITLLTGGLSSALVYKITVAQQAYVLRIVMNVNPLNDPKREYACMQLAADAGIAPTVYYTHAEDAVSVTRFIAAPPIWQQLTDKTQQLRSLARHIKIIHSLPLFPELVNFLDGVDMFIEQFKSLHLFPAAIADPYFEHYTAVANHYRRYEADIVSSHNDLNPGNILSDDQQLWVLDWETAFRNDRYADLAITALYFTGDTDQENILLQEYFGDTLNEEKRTRFFFMQQVVYMYYAMIMLRMAAAGRPDFKPESDMTTPGLQEVRGMIGRGEVSLSSYEGQLLFGKTLLNTILKNSEKITALL